MIFASGGSVADPSTTAITVAQYGAVAAIIGSLVTLALGLLTLRREKEQVADESVEEVLEQRLVLKDEQLKHKDNIIHQLTEENKGLRKQLARDELAINETRAEERAYLDERE